MCDGGDPRSLYAGLARVGEGAADVGVVGDGFAGEDGHVGAREEGDLEGAAGDEGDDPLGFVGAAEGVLVEESFVAGDAGAVEVADGGGALVEVEGGADLGGGEGADLGHGEGGEVDRDFFGREADVAGDGGGVLACGAPVAALLGGCEGEAGEGGEQERADERGSVHGSSMTLRRGLIKLGGKGIQGLLRWSGGFTPWRRLPKTRPTVVPRVAEWLLMPKRMPPSMPKASENWW